MYNISLKLIETSVVCLASLNKQLEPKLMTKVKVYAGATARALTMQVATRHTNSSLEQIKRGQNQLIFQVVINTTKQYKGNKRKGI